MIVIQEQDLLCWLGIDPPTDGRVVEAIFRWNGDPESPASDYDRACDVADYTALIPVGQEHGLVLAEPSMTTWWPGSENRGGYLVRWEYADDGSNLPEWMSQVPDLPALGEALEWEIADSSLYLFDSAYSGQDVLDGMSDDFLKFELNPRRYIVSRSLYRPDESTSFILHRFVRMD